jgi:Holliday junction resolvase-like predicted endonuclease
MRQLGIWRINGDSPQKVIPASVDIEKQLEEWIERDPGLVEADLTIVGRQVHTEGGWLDLLAVDPHGSWVIIELKRGSLYRETLAQALDYAACIAAMPAEELREVATKYLSRASKISGVPVAVEKLTVGDSEREVRVCVVGTGKDTSLERLTTFLSGRYGIPISVVTFEVYQLESGDRILVRQLAEAEAAGRPDRDVKPRSIEELCARADAKGIGPQFRSIVDAAQRHGMYVKSAKDSFFAAPLADRRRSLFSVWSSPDDEGRLQLWLGTEVFAKFYPRLSETDVESYLGEGSWRNLSAEEAQAFVSGLDALFTKLSEIPLRDLAEIADSEEPSAYWADEELRARCLGLGIDLDTPEYEEMDWTQFVEAVVNKHVQSPSV